MLEFRCHLLDVKIAGELAIKNKTLNRAEFDAFVASQSRIRDLEQQMVENNKTIEMIRSAAHNLILQQPEKEKEISERFEPRIKHFTEELQKKVTFELKKFQN